MSGELSHRHRKWLGWFSLLARFASVQVAIQVLGFLSGILVVRHLSKPDYAWFTIANTLVATLAMLADSGVSGALSAVGGTVWQDDAGFGSLIRTALTLRRKLAIAAVTVVTPVSVWMLAKDHAPAATIAVVLPAALVGFWLQLGTSVLTVVISLRQEIRRMQIAGLTGALVRVALIAPVCLLFPGAGAAVVVGTIALASQAWLVRRWVTSSITLRAPESADFRSRILAVVRKQAPLTIFYCLQSQIIIWLISIFGSAQRVAEIGALGRFAVLFTLISSVTNGIVIPRFARCQNPAILRRRYWQVAFGFAVLASLLVGFSAAYPRLLLWVLGSQYANLEKEVWLMMLSASVAGVFASLVSLTYSKGWIVPAAISIPLEIIVQVSLVLVFDVSTVRGVLWIGCFTPLPLIVMNIIVAHLEMRKLPSQSESSSAAS